VTGLPTGHADRSREQNRRNWWTADEGEVHKDTLEYVTAVDRLQAPLFDKFIKLESLYDTNPRTNVWNDKTSTEILGIVTENVVASNIDTVTATVAATDVRARFMTTDADWAQQRQAKHLEWYCDGLSSMFELGDRGRKAFKDSAIKGTGLVKIYVDQFGEIRVDRVVVDDVVVDELEARNGKPRQLHYRTLLDRDDLKAQFPEYAEEIEKAQMTTIPGRNWRLWAGYRPVKDNEVVVIESWHLPIGTKGKKGYVPGRHAITIDGCDLIDEPYHKKFFPFAKLVWVDPVRGWYGISLAERIAGIQRALNRRNLQIEKTLDRAASPTTYVQIADANLAVKTSNRIGNIAVYKAGIPQTVSPPLVSGETYQSRQDLKSAAFEESGVSRMAAQSTKPAGIDSGVALREYRDQTTQRFALQEKAFEQFWLDCLWLLLDCCKDLGDSAPVVMKKTKFGSRKIEWADVDMTDLRVTMQAASTLSQTPAGREQSVTEWAQAGIISTDEARQLIDHPDLERALSINTAALQDIEDTIQEIEDGKIVMPEPFQNIKLGLWRMQREYLRIHCLGAPEEVLESLRQWMVQAGYILNPPAPPQPAMPAGPMAGAPMPGGPVPPGPMPPGAMPPGPMPGGAPPAFTNDTGGGAPAAAFAPNAYNPMAS
jgi:hypothetical protein